MEKRLTEIIEIGDPEGATKALIKIGETYEDFANEFHNPPVPRGLSLEETDFYKAELKKQAYPIDDKASNAYRRAVENSLEHHLSSEVVNEAKLKLRKYEPNVFLEAVDWRETPAVANLEFNPTPPEVQK